LHEAIEDGAASKAGYDRSVKSEEIARLGMENEFATTNQQIGSHGRNWKRKAPKEEKKEERPVEVQTWDVFYTGTSNLAAENSRPRAHKKLKRLQRSKRA
jgi:hypothetical protein